MIKVYCYPKCSTCKKALAFLQQHEIPYELFNIKEQHPTSEQIKEWHSLSGLPLKKFFNTSGLVYKELGLKDKLTSMSDQEQYEILGTDGMLIKRPLVIGDNFVLTGFRQAEWVEKI